MNTTDQPVLVFQGGPENGRTVVVLPRFIMGREPENDIVVDDLGVSGQHAAILQAKEGYYLRDLSSSTGTFVNRKNITIEDHLLQQGDQIQLGASEVVFAYLVQYRPTFGTPDTVPLIEEESVIGATEGPAQDSQENDGNVNVEFLVAGNVVLNIQTEGNEGQMLIRFVGELRKNPPFRFLRLAKNRKSGVDVWLSLRWPIKLTEVLSANEVVADVSGGRRDTDGDENDGPVFTILLK